jgi:hypothetical protein
MAWYQVQKHLLDYVNGHDLEAGIYVETDCVNWVARFGSDIRALSSGELPKDTFKKVKVLVSVEDSVVEVPVVEDSTEEDADSEIEAVKPAKEGLTRVKEVKPPLARRKVSNTSEAEGS